jgi:hypothetical protein
MEGLPDDDEHMDDESVELQARFMLCILGILELHWACVICIWESSPAALNMQDSDSTSNNNGTPSRKKNKLSTPEDRAAQARDRS